MDPVSSRISTGAASPYADASTPPQAVQPVAHTGNNPQAGGRSGPRLPGGVQELLDAARRALTEAGGAAAPLRSAGSGSPWGTALAEALLQGAGNLPVDLVEVLQGLALRPGADGEALRTLLAAAGRLPAELLGGTPRGNPSAALLAVVEAQLLPGLEVGQPLTAVERQALSQMLDESLRQAVWLMRDAAGAQVSVQALAGLAGAFQGELARVLGRMDGAGPWRAALASMSPGELLAGREGALIRALYAEAGPLLRRSIQALAQGALAGEIDARLEEAAQEAGPSAEKLRRIQGALDQERLASEIRQRQDGGLSWSLPLADAAGWTSLALWMGQRRAASGAEEGAERSYRVQLEADLSSLGPVRASLLMGSGRIAVRLEVTRPSTAQLLRRVAGDLEAQLGAEGQRVVLAVVMRPEEQSLLPRAAGASRRGQTAAPEPYIGPGVDVRG